MTSKDVIEGHVRTVSLFSNLLPDALDALAAGSRLVAVKKNTRVLEEGSAADCCLVLVSGRAKVVLSGDNGSEILLGVVRPTSLVGEVALLDRSTRTASLVAVEPSRFIRIPAPVFDRLRQDPDFEHRMVARVASMLREANDQVRGVSTFPATARVAWCLGRVARLDGRRDGDAIVIPRMPHHELAEMAGCSRETVSRALGALRRRKCLSWDHASMRLELTALRLHEIDTGATAQWAYRLGALGLG